MDVSTMDVSTTESKGFEIQCGLTIAIFAAVLSITDLYGGKYGDDEIKAINEKAATYMWYQSKSIKETLVEGQKNLLQTLNGSGAIGAQHVAAIQQQINSLKSAAERYNREKQEILLGSTKVGPQNWAQDLDGEKGKVIGAEEWGAEAERLAKAGDRLDLASLFLQLCLVLGAVSLVLQNRRSQLVFYGLMTVLGLIGTGISAYSFLAASA